MQEAEPGGVPLSLGVHSCWAGSPRGERLPSPDSDLLLHLQVCLYGFAIVPGGVRAPGHRHKAGLLGSRSAWRPLWRCGVGCIFPGQRHLSLRDCMGRKSKLGVRTAKHHTVFADDEFPSWGQPLKNVPSQYRNWEI